MGMQSKSRYENKRRNSVRGYKVSVKLQKDCNNHRTIDTDPRTTDHRLA
jgi:hypothetical protein